MNEVWIKARSDGFPGSGTQADPFNGVNPDRLDPLLRAITPNTVINFFPGEYRTRGFHEGAASLSDVWQLKRGWKMHGAGIDITTLKLVDAVQDDDRYSVVGSTYHANADWSEISDMTIDCDGNGNPAKSAFQAVSVYGSHIHPHHIKAVGWGARGPLEAFAVGASGGHHHAEVGRKQGNIVEDCIAVEPCGRPALPEGVVDEDPGSSVFCVFGGDTEDILHDAPVIRRCFVDAGIDAKNIRAFSMGGVRAGIVEGNVALNAHHGFYLDTGMNRGLTISRNRFLRVVQGVGFNYHNRVEAQPIESEVEILGNEMTIRKGPGASGIGMLGAKSVGPVTFKMVLALRNTIEPAASPGEIAGIAVYNAGFAEVRDNVIALPSTNRRIQLERVGGWIVEDKFYAEV